MRLTLVLRDVSRWGGPYTKWDMRWVRRFNETIAAKDFYKREAISHTRRVCSLYKRAARDIEDWCEDRCEYLYEVAVLRSRFEKNRHIKDMRVAKQLVLEGEMELFRECTTFPPIFDHSPHGVCYGREHVYDDAVLDQWHPIEKAMFPIYFARREQRKLEYLKLWELGTATTGGPGLGRNYDGTPSDKKVDISKITFPFESAHGHGHEDSKHH